jgi:hypothetical protein
MHLLINETKQNIQKDLISEIYKEELFEVCLFVFIFFHEPNKQNKKKKKKIEIIGRRSNNSHKKASTCT